MIPSLVEPLQAKAHTVADTRLRGDLEDHLLMLRQGDEGPLRVFELILVGAIQFFQREGMANTAHTITMTVWCHVDAHHASTMG
ncbi:MAG: hypothetical protein QM706_07470 [Nitrospira sp.]